MTPKTGGECRRAGFIVPNTVLKNTGSIYRRELMLARSTFLTVSSGVTYWE